MALSSRSGAITDLDHKNITSVVTGAPNSETVIRNFYVKHKADANRNQITDGIPETPFIVGKSTVNPNDWAGGEYMRTFPISDTKALILASSTRELGDDVVFVQVIELLDAATGKTKTYAPLIIDYTTQMGNYQSTRIVQLTATKFLLKYKNGDVVSINVNTDNTIDRIGAYAGSMAGTSVYDIARLDDNTVICAGLSGSNCQVQAMTVPDSGDPVALGSINIPTAGVSGSYVRIARADRDNPRFGLMMYINTSTYRYTRFDWDGATNTPTAVNDIALSVAANPNWFDIESFYDDTNTYGTILCAESNSPNRFWWMDYDGTSALTSGTMNTNGQSSSIPYLMKLTDTSVVFSMRGSTTTADFVTRTGLASVAKATETDGKHSNYVGFKNGVVILDSIYGDRALKFTNGVKSYLSGIGEVLFSWGLGLPQSGRWNTAAGHYFAIGTTRVYVLDADLNVVSSVYTSNSYPVLAFDVTQDGKQIYAVCAQSISISVTSTQAFYFTWEWQSGVKNYLQNATAFSNSIANPGGYGSWLPQCVVIDEVNSRFVVSGYTYNAGTYYANVKAYNLDGTVANSGEYNTGGMSSAMAHFRHSAVAYVASTNEYWFWYLADNSGTMTFRKLSVSNVGSSVFNSNRTNLTDVEHRHVCVVRDGLNTLVMTAHEPYFITDKSETLITDNEFISRINISNLNGTYGLIYFDATLAEKQVKVIDSSGKYLFEGSYSWSIDDPSSVGFAVAPDPDTFYVKGDGSFAKTIIFPGALDTSVDVYMTYNNGANDFLLFENYPISIGDVHEMPLSVLIPGGESLKLKAGHRWHLDVFYTVLERS